MKSVCACTDSREPFCSAAAQLAVEHGCSSAAQCMSATNRHNFFSSLTQPGLHPRNGRSEDRKSSGMLPLVLFRVVGTSWQASSWFSCSACTALT